MSDEVTVDAGCSFVVSLADLTPSNCPFLTVNVLLANKIEIFVFYLCIHTVLVL